MDYTIPPDAFDKARDLTLYGNRAYLDDVAAKSGGELRVVERGPRFALAVFDPVDGFLGFL